MPSFKPLAVTEPLAAFVFTAAAQAAHCAIVGCATIRAKPNTIRDSAIFKLVFMGTNLGIFFDCTDCIMITPILFFGIIHVLFVFSGVHEVAALSFTDLILISPILSELGLR